MDKEQRWLKKELRKERERQVKDEWQRHALKREVG